MENTTEKQEYEFTFVSFLKIFKGKLKMLLAVALISTILGGTIGALVFTVGKKTYGNMLAFYLPTPELTGYSAVIPLLESDLFTEKILIGTKTVNGVKIPDLPYSAEEETLIIEYESKKLKATEDIKVLKSRLKTLPSEIDNLRAQYEAARSTYSPFKEERDKLWTVYDDKLAADAKARLDALEANPEYKKAKAEFDAAQKIYNDTVIQQAEATEKLLNAENTLTEVTEKSDVIVNKLSSEWKKDSKNKKLVDSFHKHVTYSFTKDGKPLDNINQTIPDTSGKFLYINVEIPEDKDLANKIITNILSEISEFVISNMTPVEKSDHIECLCISSGEARDVNDDTLLISIGKFSLIFLAIFEVLAILAILASHFKKIFFPTPEPTVDCIEEGNKENTESAKEELTEKSEENTDENSNQNN
ncbi:MAG: hypothetical protein E7678_02345 [Ruminococcaceae bacterium]|nr:hypothetical protein [Oscillospiraceae bacterium]